jgi:hypothetical protein
VRILLFVSLKLLIKRLSDYNADHSHIFVPDGHSIIFRSALNSNEDVADYLISTIRICNGIYQNCVQAACQNSTLIWSHGLTQ